MQFGIHGIQNGGFKMVVAEMKNRDNIGENVYWGVIAVADYESVIRFSKFKMAYSRSLIRFKIQNGGFNMVVTEIKNHDNIGENINLGDCRGVNSVFL